MQGPILFLIYINDFQACSDLFEIPLFDDDANLFSRHKDLNILQTNTNKELQKVHEWLCVNKLSLNIDKSNFVLFHPPQKKIINKVELSICDNSLKQNTCIRYLGILIDANLGWKPQINYIGKKNRERRVCPI